jgi:hypothetical protein
MERPTRRIAHLDTHEPIIRWGTATLSPDAQIKLHVLGQHDPIWICLTNPLVLGRADQDNGIEVNVDLSPYGAAAQGVSRHHASLELIRKTVMLTDLGSTNGTFLNDQRLLPQQRRVVRDNDEIRLGKLIIHIYF